MVDASYDSKSYNPTELASFGGILFNNDGTKAYFLNSSASPDEAYQYSLSTAYDISSATYDTKSLDFSAQDTQAVAFLFNDDGSKIFYGGITNSNIYEYTLSTDFDISTETYTSNTFSVTTQTTTMKDFAFNADGTVMYVIGNAADSIYLYDLSTGYSLGFSRFRCN